MTKPFIILEEILTTHFDSLVSSESHSSRLSGKQPHRYWDNSEWNIQGKYDMYTHLKVSHERIYQEFVNTEF